MLEVTFAWGTYSWLYYLTRVFSPASWHQFEDAQRKNIYNECLCGVTSIHGVNTNQRCRFIKIQLITLELSLINHYQLHSVPHSQDEGECAASQYNYWLKEGILARVLRRKCVDSLLVHSCLKRRLFFQWMWRSWRISLWQCGTSSLVTYCSYLVLTRTFFPEKCVRKSQAR